MTVSVLWLFLAVSWVSMQCVIVVFPDHTYLLFCNKSTRRLNNKSNLFLNILFAMGLSAVCDCGIS